MTEVYLTVAFQTHYLLNKQIYFDNKEVLAEADGKLRTILIARYVAIFLSLLITICNFVGALIPIDRLYIADQYINLAF